MARLHGAIERDPAQHQKLIVRVKEILAQVARCVPRLFCSSPRGPDGRALHAGLRKLDLPWWAWAEMPVFCPPVGFWGSAGAKEWDPAARPRSRAPLMQDLPGRAYLMHVANGRTPGGC